QSLGVTPTHLTRCCKAACGRPASALLQDRRLFEARRLLAETRIPINHIALSLGFASAAYFTRAFQHLTGQSPSAFRRSLPPREVLTTPPPSARATPTTAR